MRSKIKEHSSGQVKMSFKLKRSLKYVITLQPHIHHKSASTQGRQASRLPILKVTFLASFSYSPVVKYHQSRPNYYHVDHKKKKIGHVISKQIHFNYIPLHTNNNTYYCTMLSVIQENELSIQPLTRYEKNVPIFMSNKRNITDGSKACRGIG